MSVGPAVGVLTHHLLCQKTQQQYKQPPPPPPPSAVDQSTVTVLSDRISTLEGRQSASQSKLAQIAKVLGIDTGKPEKHSICRCKGAGGLNGSEAEIRTALGDVGVGNDEQQAVSMNTVLEALSGEHEASLARLSGSYE
ncbi:hypothetical protein DD237_008527 [Peronospora effusa]|uniref:Uncharacterized protein n=1 Tax=Peronospora effusa TaxID=542832 RepID=A0A425C060_9STRA|nr:hypothetical protein DD237_008527 [Peronospora effusa]